MSVGKAISTRYGDAPVELVYVVVTFCWIMNMNITALSGSHFRASALAGGHDLSVIDISTNRIEAIDEIKTTATKA